MKQRINETISEAMNKCTNVDKWGIGFEFVSS